MVKGDDTVTPQKMESRYTGFSVYLQSRFVFSACLWISMVSSTLLFQYAGSCFNTLAFSQSTLCWCSNACTAIPLFVSPLSLLLLYVQLISVSGSFLVSPMYELLQSIHESHCQHYRHTVLSTSTTAKASYKFSSRSDTVLTWCVQPHMAGQTLLLPNS